MPGYQVIKTFLLDDYYISKPSFIGSKPDFKITVEKIISGVLSFYLPQVKHYWLSTWGIDQKTGKWDESFSEDKVVTESQKELENICRKLFAEDKNLTDFELYLYDKDISSAKFSWSLGDFIYLKTTLEDFEKFQSHLDKVGLPKTLFYKKGDEVAAPLQSRHIVSKLFNAVGWRRNYTPMEWKNYRLGKH